MVVIMYRAATRSPRCHPKRSGPSSIIVVIQPSSPLLSLSLLSSTELRGPPDRHVPAHSSVNLHQHHYRYCRCHLQSGHQIAIVSSKAPWAFVANGSSSTLLSLSLLSSTEPRGPPDSHGPIQSSVSFIATVIIYRHFHLQNRTGHQIAVISSKAQWAFIATVRIMYRAE